EEKQEEDYKTKASITFSTDNSATKEESENIPSGEKPRKQESNNNDITGKADDNAKESGLTLPKTATDIPLFIAVGSFMLLVGLCINYLLSYKKKKSKEQEIE